MSTHRAIPGDLPREVDPAYVYNLADRLMPMSPGEPARPSGEGDSSPEAGSRSPAADLRKTQRVYLTKHEAMHAARVARDEAISDALAAGIPHKQIMDATGLSRARLAQIKRETR